ncbi:unnamed protein product, partial [Sphacelaria rigidula]
TNLPDGDTIELDQALEDVVSNVAGVENAQLLGMMSPSLFDRSCRRRARRISSSVDARRDIKLRRVSGLCRPRTVPQGREHGWGRGGAGAV